MLNWQNARVIFYSVSNNEIRPIFVVCNSYRALLTTALMPVKQYIVFRCLLQFSAKHWFKTILQDSSLPYSRIKSPEHIHHMLIQVYCRPFAWQSIKVRAHKRYMQSKKTKFSCSNVSLDIFLLLTKITRDFTQKGIKICLNSHRFQSTAYGMYELKCWKR